MKVSVVIPVYNAAKYLEECIDSALNQTYKDMEIIAVDDGSTDESPKILKKYSGKIKIIRKENGGTPSALNVGIKNMEGEWFKWLSADDVLYENAVQVLMQEAELLKDAAKSCIFYSSYDIINEKSKIIGEVIEPNYNNLADIQRNVILLDHFYGNGITSIIHKSIFEKCGEFDESIGFKEDYEFWLRCCLVYGCKLHLIQVKLAKYRVHETQLTRTRVRENLEHVQSIRNYVLEKIPDDRRTLYLDNLRAYQKTKPLKVRLRRQMRDLMLRIFPRDVSGTVIETYVNRKNSES